jgi:hypothetical protein
VLFVDDRAIYDVNGTHLNGERVHRHCRTRSRSCTASHSPRTCLGPCLSTSPLICEVLTTR